MRPSPTCSGARRISSPLLEANGYALTLPMTTFGIELADIDPRRLLGPKQQEILADPDYRWMPIDRRDFTERLEDFRLILNDGFDANPMFVPPTAEEYRFQAGDMMWVIDKRISTVAPPQGRAGRRDHRDSRPQPAGEGGGRADGPELPLPLPAASLDQPARRHRLPVGQSRLP